MRKIILFVVAMLGICFCAYSKKKKNVEEIKTLIKTGQIEKIGSLKKGDESIVEFGQLNELVLALTSGKINEAVLPECTANYLAKKNPNIEIVKDSGTIAFYHMLALPENQALINDINSALYNLMNDQLKTISENQIRNSGIVLNDNKQGIFRNLIQKHIAGVLNGAKPERIKMPVAAGYETITVAVTGDLPPFDYVDDSGNCAGFNMALLSLISLEIKKNIKIINIDAGARSSVLASGKADVIFWVQEDLSEEEAALRHKEMGNDFNSIAKYRENENKKIFETGTADIPMKTVPSISFYEMRNQVVRLKK